MQYTTINNALLKRERLEVRIPKSVKLLLQRAADIQGRSLSDFLTATAEKAATEIIRENQVVQLSVADSLAFTKALLNKSKPDKKLQSAFSAYKRSVSSQ